MPDGPAKKATPAVAPKKKAAAPALPTHKDDLAALAIDRGIPSYEAWDMTVEQLTAKLEA